MQLFPFNLTVGGSLEIKCSGSFIKVLSLLSLPLIDTARLSVRTQQDEFPMAGGASADLGQTSKSWFLINKTASALSGEIVIGIGAYTDPSVAAAVAVIDTALSNVLGQRSFWATGSAAANGTQYSAIGLQNTSGTKNMVIDTWELLGYEPATLPIVRFKMGAGTVAALGSRTVLSGLSKLGSGAAGSGQLVLETNSASTYLTAGDSVLFNFWPNQWSTVGGGGPLQLVRGSPLVLPPGYFAQVSFGAPASATMYWNTTASWRELPV